MLSVAGSGKTKYIIDSLDCSKRTLIITYTNTNYENLRIRIIKKFGRWPENVTLNTYFSFLYNFCAQPLIQKQSYLKGITFNQTADMYIGESKRAYYFNDQNQAYSNRLAKLLKNPGTFGNLKARLTKYYEYLCVDEIQDFAANDFNLLISLFETNIAVLCVGDFYQHTFDTGRDLSTKSTLYKDYSKYQEHFLKAGLSVDLTTLNNSWRCPPSVCDFVSNTLGIAIKSNKNSDATVENVDTISDFVNLYNSDQVIKLFWEQSYNKGCYANNWGACKGMDEYNDVCIILTKQASEAYVEGNLKNLKPTTLSKLYVACTRANGNLYFVTEKLYKQFLKTLKS